MNAPEVCATGIAVHPPFPSCLELEFLRPDRAPHDPTYEQISARTGLLYRTFDSPGQPLLRWLRAPDRRRQPRSALHSGPAHAA